MAKIQKLIDFENKIAYLRLAISTISFDDETIAPKEGAELRNQTIGYLCGELLDLKKSEENYNMLVDMRTTIDQHLVSTLELYGEDNEVYKNCLGHKKSINLFIREIEKVRGIPKDFYISYQQLCCEATQI